MGIRPERFPRYLWLGRETAGSDAAEGVEKGGVAGQCREPLRETGIANRRGAHVDAAAARAEVERRTDHRHRFHKRRLSGLLEGRRRTGRLEACRGRAARSGC
jgi:hypothetical protein